MKNLGIMSENTALRGKRFMPTPDHVNRLLREKDRIIKAQAKRIEQLEGDVDKMRKERDVLSTKVTLLTYKLQLTNPKFGVKR